MVLVIHVVIALLSVGFSSITAINPDRAKLAVSYILTGSTLGTGIALVLVEPATMVRACIVGIVYFVIISYIILSTHKKLLAQEIEK